MHTVQIVSSNIKIYRTDVKSMVAEATVNGRMTVFLLNSPFFLFDFIYKKSHLYPSK